MPKLNLDGWQIAFMCLLAIALDVAEPKMIFFVFVFAMLLRKPSETPVPAPDLTLGMRPTKVTYRRR